MRIPIYNTFEELLLAVVVEEPEKYGYDFGRWTGARLAIHLEKETGIKLSGSQISRILQKKAVRPCGFSSR